MLLNLNDSKKLNKNILIIIFIYLILLVVSVKKPLIAVGSVILMTLIMYLIEKPKRLIYFQIIYNSIIKFLISDFNIPNFSNYITDVITLLIVLVIFPTIDKNNTKISKIITMPIICIGLFFITSIFSLIVNQTNILRYIWSFRNIFRFYAFFLGCIYLLKKEDIKKVVNILFILLILNMIVCTYQYFLQGLRDDQVGGLFGTIVGGNSGMNILLSQITIYAVVMYMNKNKSIFYPITVILISLYIATISELKVYYIEILIILLISIFLSKKNNRTMIVLGLGLIATIGSIQIMYTLYPTFNDFFNKESILKYSASSGYSEEGNLNRFTAIQTLNKDILTNKVEKVIGIGMGNAETSQYSILNSSFYQEYGEILRYTWFSHAFMFIEGGYIGLILYFGFFIIIFIQSRKIKYKDNISNSYMIIAQITSLMCILYGSYNVSLRIESSGYLIYSFLAIPFIVANNKINKKGEIEVEPNG